MEQESDKFLQRLLDELPAAARPMVKGLYSRLSAEQKESARSFLHQAETYLGLNETKQLLKLVRDQYMPAFAGPRRVCIVGPVNSGKSSLYNALLTSKADRAEVSPIPGTTKTAQEGAAGILTAVDTPGADDVEIGWEGEQAGLRRRESALQAAQDADFLLMVFDATTGITRGVLNVYKDLVALNKPYLVALNKIDLVKRDQEQLVAMAARTLGLDVSQVIPISALRGTNLDRLVIALVRANPELLASLGMVLPQFRAQMAAEYIRNAAGAAGTVNLITSPIPVPFTSFVPLTAIQAGLVLSLARLYGHRITAARAKEILATLGAGYGARTLFQQLVTKVPGPGWIVGTAIAAATTVAIGYSAQLWFARGEKLSAEKMREFASEAMERVVQAMRALGKKRPSKQEVSAAIDQALRAIVMRRADNKWSHESSENRESSKTESPESHKSLEREE